MHFFITFLQWYKLVDLLELPTNLLSCLYVFLLPDIWRESMNQLILQGICEMHWLVTQVMNNSIRYCLDDYKDYIQQMIRIYDVGWYKKWGSRHLEQVFITVSVYLSRSQFKPNKIKPSVTYWNRVLLLKRSKELLWLLATVIIAMYCRVNFL